MKKFYALAAVLAFVPGAAMAQDNDSDAKLTGVRAEARIGYETPTVSDSTGIYKIGSAVSYGGEIGFDLKVGSKVQVGPYAAYEFSSVKLCDTGACIKEDGNLAVGGRIGVAVSPKAVIYGKAATPASLSPPMRACSTAPTARTACRARSVWTITSTVTSTS